jgi:hypothetical protein
MLSPGLFMAMHSADLLDKHAFSKGAAALERPEVLAKGFAKVFAELEDWHRAWTEVIEYFYDGRMYSLYEGGEQLKASYGKYALPVIMERHLTKQITRLVSGVATRSKYGRGLLKFTHDRLLKDVQPAEFYAIR